MLAAAPPTAWLWIVVQLVASVVAVRLLRRRVLDDGIDVDDGLVAAVWVPFVIIVPFLFLTVRVGDSVVGAGWVVSGAPAALGVFGLGLGLLRPTVPPSVFAVFMWLVAGVLLLLLGAAHDLLVSVGHCALAAGVVLLWVNTPGGRPPDHRDASRSSGLLLALLLGLVQGGAALLAGPELVLVAAGAAVGSAAVAVVIVARSGVGGLGLRAVGWMTTYGILLGLGVLSMRRVIPQVRGLARGEILTVQTHVAYGFGAYALEAVAFILSVPLAVAVVRAEPVIRKTVGTGLAIAGVGLLLGRFAMLLLA